MSQRVINLLPPKLQDNARFRKHWLSFKRLAAVALVALGSVLVLEIGLRIYIEKEKVSVERKKAELQRIVDEQDSEGVKKEVRKLNGFLADYNKLKAEAPQWSSLMKLLATLTPSGVKLQSVAADATAGAMQVSGFSPTREQVLQFYDNVKADTEHFSSIDFPLENITKSTTINFRFNLKLKPAAYEGATP